MFLLDGKPLQVDVPFIHNGIQYPANWLRLTTWEEKSAIGITEVSDPIRPDERFYYVSMQGDPVPKDLDSLKETFKNQVNTTTYAILQTTDWYVIRNQETGVEIPEKIATHRNAVRAASEANKTALNAATNLEEFIAAVEQMYSSWPVLEPK